MTVRDLAVIGPVRASSLCDPLRSVFPVFFEERKGIHARTIAKRYSKVNSNLLIRSRSMLLSNSGMDARARRRENLERLAKQYGTLEHLAELTESAPAHFSQVRNGNRNIGHKVARRIEAKLQLAAGWMDVPHEQSEPVQGQLAGAALLRDFEGLPPLLQEHIAKTAHQLRELVEGVPEKYRRAISAPPSDPESYADWERAIKELWSITTAAQSATQS